jgi:hypothetical protein
MHFRRVEKMPPHGRCGQLPSSLTVEQLTQVFGEPEDAFERSDRKQRFEWRMKFDDGTWASIWDYKGARWSVGGLGAEGLLRGEIEHVLGVVLPERDEK